MDDEKTPDGSTSEAAEGRQRIEALERALSEAQATLSDLRSRYDSLHDLLMRVSTPICVWSGDDFVFTLVNPACNATMPEREMLGKPLLEVIPEATEQGIWPLLERVYRTGEPYMCREMPVMIWNDAQGIEEQRWFHAVYAPVRDGRGGIVGVCHIGVELTEQVRARYAAELKAEELQRSAELIAAQQATIRALSTPLLPLAHGVLAMPLIGPIDAQRSEQMLTELLQGVAKGGVTTVILDVTGVETIDAQAADAVIRAAQAVRLLGARVLMTGIRPSMAHALVQLGVELRGIDTYATLQSGIAAAMSAK